MTATITNVREGSGDGFWMAAIQNRYSGTADVHLAGQPGPAQSGGFNLERVIGLSGAQLEWSLAPIRLVLAAAVLLLALTSEGMESARPLWLVVAPVAALYTGTIVLLLYRGHVRRAAALGIFSDLVLAAAVFPALHYFVSRNDPDNLSYAAEPAVALMTLAILISTLRLKLWPAVLAGVFMTLVPAGLAWLLTAEGTPGAGIGGDAVTFAASAAVFTIIGQAIQRTRSSLEWQVTDTRRLYSEAEDRADERELLAELGRIVSQSPDVRETYERFAETVRTVLAADRVSVNIYDHDHDVLVTTYISGTEIDGWREHASHRLEETPLGEVIRERRGLLLKGTQHDTSTIASVAAGMKVGMRSAIVVPLQHQGEVIGTLGLRSRHPDAYDEDSLDLLEQIGAQIAPAVANAGLYSALERDAKERSVFAEISRILSASPDIADVYEDFVEQARKLVRWDRISVNFVDPETGRLRTAYAAGYKVPEYPIGSPRPPGHRSILEHVVRTGEALLVEDILELNDRFPDSAAAVQAGLRSGIYVPLMSDGAVIGTLAAGAGEPHAYSDMDLRLLERMAAQVAGTFANAELRARTDRQAREEAALAEIGRIITSSLRIEDVYDQFAEQVRALMPADRVSVIEVDPEFAELTIRYVSGLAIPSSTAGTRRKLRRNGPLQAVIRTGKSLAIPDLREQLARYPDLRPIAESGVRSAIYSPLKSQGEVIGVLCVATTEPGAHDEYHFKLLERISAQIAGAVANAGLHQRANRQAREEAALAEIGRIVNSSLDIETVYEQFAEQVGRILNFDRIAITRLGPGGDEFTITHLTGVEVPGLEVGTVWKLAETPFGPVLNDGETLFLQGDETNRSVAMVAGMAKSFAAGVVSSVVVPIIERDRPVGFFSVRSLAEDAYTEADAVLARRVAALVSSAITNAELLGRSDRQAREEAALAEIGRIVNSSLDIDTVYEQFAEQVSRILNFDRLAIGRIGPDEGKFTISHVTGVEIPGLEIGAIWELAETPLSPVLKDGKTLILQGTETIELAASFRIMAESITAGIGSSVVVPLIERDRPVGFFSVRTLTENAYTETDAVLARRVAALVSSAITNAELLSRSERQAHEEAALGEIGRIITSSLKIDDVYDLFAANLRTLMPADRVSVIEVGPGTGELTMRYVSEFSPRSAIYGTTGQWSQNALMEVVVRTGEGLAIPDLRARIRDFPDAQPVLDSGVVSLLYSPLRAQGQVIGLLCVVSTEVGAHSAYHFELLERISAQIAGALANARLHELSERQAREEAALGEIGRIVNSSLDIETVYEQFAEQVKQILPFDRLVIGVRDPDGIHASVAHVTGIDVPGLEAGTVRVISDTNLEPVLERGETLFQQGGRGQDQLSPIPGATQGIASSLFVPLISRDRPIGFLALRIQQEEAYTEAQAVLARRVAALASTAISNSVLYERAESEARERAVLAEIGRIVGSSLDIDSVYSRFANQVRELIDFDRISITYVSSHRDSVVYAWAEGKALTGFGIGREIPIKAFVGTRLGKLMRRRRGAALSEAEIGEFLDRLPWANESTARSMIVVPLVSDDRTIAGLTLISSKPDAYGSQELEIATRVGSQVAGAVANARLHTALREASEELKDINTQKTELMTTVAHELRSPLTALRAFMDLVLEGTAGDVPEKQLELLMKASRSTTRMQNLLNMFSHLEMAEDHSVPLTVTMFDIGTVVSGAIDLLQPSAAQARVEVKAAGFDDLPLIEGDRQAIEQVVSNLISNAIKYSHEGGAVAVNCEAGDKDVIVSVTDTGFGISAEDQERLFERFYRGSDPVKRRIRGTGLGLYVSRGLVQRHHGRMWIKSEAGRGSAFSFSLPYEQPAEEPAGRDAPAA